MNNAQLLKLTAVLAVLVALVFGRNAWNQYQLQQPNDYRKAVADLSMDTVKKISITQAGKTVELVADMSSWKVATKSADRAMIEDLITAMSPETNPLLISESKQQQQAFGINDQEGYKVVFTYNNQDLELLVGPKRGSGNPVVVAGSNQTYSIAEMPNLYTDPDRWVDLTIVKMDGSSVKELSWDSFAVVKGDDGRWVFKDGSETVNQDEVTKLLTELNPLEGKALAYEQKRAEYPLAKPTYRLSVTDVNGQVTTLEVFKGKIDYLLKRVENEEYYLLKEKTGTLLNQQKTDLIAATQ